MALDGQAPRSSGTNTVTRLAAALCLLAILLGPLYTEPGYSWVHNAISELAGQDTHNAWIMRLGLGLLGLSTIMGFIRQRDKFNVFFLLFGVFIMLSAIFPHKPFIEGRAYSEGLDQWHSAFASLGGMSAVGGFTMLAIRAPDTRPRWLYITLASAYTLLPMAMFALPAFQGLFQRMIFFSFILWILLQGGPKTRMHESR